MRGSIIGTPWYLRAPISRSTIAASTSPARVDVVVPHHVAEVVRLLELVAGERDPLLDLAGRLRRTLAQPPLELVDVGAAMKIVHAPGTSRLHVQRPVELELEHADAAVPGDPVDLRPQRAVALAARRTSTHSRNSPSSTRARELVVVEEPVLAAVLLARRAAGASSRRPRPRAAGTRSSRAADQRALAGAGRAGDDEDGLTLPTGGTSGHRRRSRGSPMVEEPDELGALALGEAADRLRLADPALVQEPRRLHAAELRARPSACRRPSRSRRTPAGRAGSPRSGRARPSGPSSAARAGRGCRSHACRASIRWSSDRAGAWACVFDVTIEATSLASSDAESSSTVFGDLQGFF